MNLLAPFGWAGFGVLAVILILRELRPILDRRNGKNGLRTLNGAASSPSAGQMPKEYWQLEMRESFAEGMKATNELLARMVCVQEEMRDLHREYIPELKALKEEVSRHKP